MQNKDLNEILSKINEMRAVFVLGQRAIPFLEEIFVFLREISPLLNDINDSIRDSTSKMPRATSQLQSVSNANELATTEILDLIDDVLDQLGPLRAGYQETTATIDKAVDQHDRLDGMLQDLAREKGFELPDEMRSLLQEHRNTVHSLEGGFEPELEILDNIRARVNRIMISLQVQDITAQQIASVNHLIESMRARMTSLISRLGRGPNALIDEEWPIYARAAFDPNARYHTDGKHQEIVDSLMSSHESDTVDAEPPDEPVRDHADDDFINSIMAGAKAANAGSDGGPAGGDDDDDAGPASQDEIDALFKTGFSS